MRIQYVCKDVSLTPSMKEACESKLSRFDRYFNSDDDVTCTVTVTVHQTHQNVEVSIVSKSGATLRAKGTEADFYASLDLVIEKLDGQMRKLKTQLVRSQKKHPAFQNINTDYIEEDDSLDIEIVRRKSLSLAPMDVDEALARMDALGHSFFIYLDSSTGLVNVLYEREEGGYGLITIED